VIERAGDPDANLLGESSLAGSAGAGERHETCRCQEFDEMLDLCATADKSSQIRRQVVVRAIADEDRRRRVAAAFEDSQIGQQLARTLITPRRLLG
jgi:hypothetical protein